MQAARALGHAAVAGDSEYVAWDGLRYAAR